MSCSRQARGPGECNAVAWHGGSPAHGDCVCRCNLPWPWNAIRSASICQPSAWSMWIYRAPDPYWGAASSCQFYHAQTADPPTPKSTMDESWHLPPGCPQSKLISITQHVLVRQKFSRRRLALPKRNKKKKDGEGHCASSG